jgi:hypothetical protein
VNSIAYWHDQYQQSWTEIGTGVTDGYYPGIVSTLCNLNDYSLAIGGYFNHVNGQYQLNIAYLIKTALGWNVGGFGSGTDNTVFSLSAHITTTSTPAEYSLMPVGSQQTASPDGKVAHGMLSAPGHKARLMH